MKKAILAVSMMALLSGGAVASELAGGLELDQKVNSQGQIGENKAGLKAFVSYEGFGLSAKRAGSNNEYNASYTHDFDSFWLKGEGEYVHQTQLPTNVGKLGLSAGTQLGEVDVFGRVRNDVALKKVKDLQSNIVRVDLGAGVQATDNVYVSAKFINQSQLDNATKKVSARNHIQNYEFRATFNNIDGIKPYVEVGNEGSFIEKDKRNSYGKIGLVLDF
ncbi:hypothetical protein A3K86_18125 [Photobacterium jeanii]|uniref:Porin n=1 Tax=Photobacterium jeanii TaxID=858640 RepID=A0A178K1D4_9GAMM|nr:hypothetical protein [Photobacterium jeanii]OAN10907.1 hypothetical protein A3K86_18125 [Photobacterium jeanii]PST90422.1 hypothetical protein C9I91_07225 [Photobacterium jeanii]